MKNKILLSLTLAASTLLAGCLVQNQDTARSEGKAAARFDIKAVAGAVPLAKITGAAPVLSIADLSGLSFNILEARANIGRIKLESSEPDSCDDVAAPDPADGDSLDTDKGDCDENELTLKGPFVIDLLSGASTPSLGNLSVPAGIYKKVKIRLEPAREGGGALAVDDALIGNTLHVKGTYTLAGLPEQSFSMILKFDEDLEMEDKVGLKLDPSAMNAILISLKAGGWMAGLKVKDCLEKPEVTASLAGAMVLSEDSPLGKCLDVESTIKENIKKSFEVDEDENGDGKDDDEEDEKDDVKDGV